MKGIVTFLIIRLS